MLSKQVLYRILQQLHQLPYPYAGPLKIEQDIGYQLPWSMVGYLATAVALYYRDGTWV